MDLTWFSDLPVVPYSQGRRLIEEGVRHGKLFFLKSGRVAVARGETVIAHLKTPGVVLGEVSVLLDSPATATVLALEDTEVFIADDPFQFLRERPEVAVQVSRTLAYRLNAATQYLVDVREQLKSCSDHVGMVDGVLDAILYRDLKKKVPVPVSSS